MVVTVVAATPTKSLAITTKNPITIITTIATTLLTTLEALATATNFCIGSY